MNSRLVKAFFFLVAVALATTPALSQLQDNWGLYVSPVYGTSETIASGVYSSAELFAGPNKFGSYFAGVAPNGAKLTPAGIVTQTGMNPLGAVLTPDGRYLITSNGDEREGGLPSFQNSLNFGSYSLNVIDTSTMKVASQITTGQFFIGVQATGSGPYTIWASGGPNNSILLYTVTSAGAISASGSIPIAPILPSTAGYVSNYTPDAYWNTVQSNGSKPPAPSGFNRTTGAQTTFPAGSTLSPDGRFLYVACNGDNSLAVIDTTTQKVVNRIPVGYFPYGVSVNKAGTKVIVANWGVTEYKFNNPTYNGNNLGPVPPTGANEPDGFYVPPTSTTGTNPKTSSVSVLTAPQGHGDQLTLVGSVYEGHTLDELWSVGDTHPSATAIISVGGADLALVTKSNSDSLGVISLANNTKLADVDLSLFPNSGTDHPIHGTYPNAIVVSHDNRRAYVAEAGINSVAVLDTTNPTKPTLLGRIPTGWYPTGLVLSRDGNTLYVANSKGVGEDVNPNTNIAIGNPPPTGVVSTPPTDSNYIFGTVQKIDLSQWKLDNTTVLANNFKKLTSADTSVVPIGDGPSKKIKHVIFILQENKTFDSMLGNLGSYFGPFAGLYYNNPDGSYYFNGQYTGVSLNTQALAQKFAAAVNYYSDSEESDAGHQFAASGTATDYTEKTLLVKSGRGLLVNKNFEPEDYPESGYIFNNAARKGITFKDYGAMIRIEGTDAGGSTPTTLNDPNSGNAGAPELQADNFHITNPLVNLGDVTSPVSGLGQSYFMKIPVLAILGTKNPSGEPRLDTNYPGYNFNISDQRRAQEFIQDFDRMVANDTLPQFIYLYLPNDHTGSVQAPNKAQVFGSATAVQQVGDGDVALGMVLEHLLNSPVYYDSESNTGAAILMTFDDAQATLDHIHPHRTPLVVVSPFAKPSFISGRHYVTASVVKTEELLLGLPPNNLGDLLATDLRDMFQPTYNGITAKQLKFKMEVDYKPTPEGTKIWSLVSKLDTSAPDRDSHRLGVLARLSMAADQLHDSAAQQNRLHSRTYKKQQSQLYATALKLVNTAAPVDND